MRELRLKYVINLVSDIAAKAKTDEQALTLAQKHVQEELQKTGKEVGILERLLMRMSGLGSKSADQHAERLAKLAMRYQDVRKQAEGAVDAMKKVAAVGAGAAAGAYAVDRITRTPMEYQARLLSMANTAYPERDKTGRIAGAGTLNSAITAAVRTGGGSRDDAAAALDTLLARGALSRPGDVGEEAVGRAMRLLPMLMRGSTASGATAGQLAGIALTGMQSFNIDLQQVPELINMAVASGQAGGFELRDMARYLPELMAMGKNTGLSGMEGARRIMASLQASIITAGTPEAAAINTKNLLAKMGSQDTAKDFAKLGIDLPSALAAGQAKGVNSIDTFVGLVDQIVGKDPRYAETVRKLASEKSDGTDTANTEAVRSIFQGAGIGTVVQDMQAMLGLVAELNQRGDVKRALEASRRNTGAVATSFDVNATSVAFQRQQALNEASFGAQNAFDKAAPALGAVASTATNVAREFPVLATGVVAATGALTVFTAALSASGLIAFLTGRAGNAAGVLAPVAAAAAAAGGGGVGASFSGLFGLLKKFPVLALASELFTTSDGDMEVLRNADLMRAGYRGRGFNDPRRVDRPGGGLPLATLNLTDPTGALEGASATNPAQRFELGQGSLDVRVVVSEERVTARPEVMSPMAGIRINTGNTNPAGY